MKLRQLKADQYYQNKEDAYKLVSERYKKFRFKTIEEFKNEVEGGLFIDDDGYGYYATDTTKSDIYVYPSDFTENIYRDDFTHIIWFNR